MPRPSPPSSSERSAAARKRWRILADALLGENRDPTDDVSVRRFTSFGVVAPSRSNGDWHEYSTGDGRFRLFVRQPRRSPTADDLIGFNNTGNVCVWPSEETLTAYVVSNLSSFRGKSVLELGGGMSCMAGLVVAKYGGANFVHVTDGNQKSVRNVEAIIERNDLGNSVGCSVLRWQSDAIDIENRYDAILVADCLFFDETREDLIRTIDSHLADDGVAYIMAPQRGDTLDRFVRTSQKYGFDHVKYEKYDNVVWERHLRLLETNPRYDPGLHYPVLLKLTKATDVRSIST